MANINDPRHNARRIALASLFEWSFRPCSLDESFEHAQNLLEEDYEFDTELAKNLVNGVKENLENIDKLVEKNATEWPLSQVAKIDLTILRLAIFELKFSNISTPPKVIIDEAIELGKEFGSETSGSFINGVLGNILETDLNKEN